MFYFIIFFFLSLSFSERRLCAAVGSDTKVIGDIDGLVYRVVLLQPTNHPANHKTTQQGSDMLETAHHVPVPVPVDGQCPEKDVMMLRLSVCMLRFSVFFPPCSHPLLCYR